MGQVGRFFFNPTQLTWIKLGFVGLMDYAYMLYALQNIKLSSII